MNNIVIELNSIAKDSYQMNEAFKSLRTNIQFCGSNLKCIALTSCMPNEGKSIISVDLALSFAEIGKKVVLIDADMRKSVMHVRYQYQPFCNGLSQYLTGQADMSDIICETQNENMFMIPCGPFPPNPAELLAGENFKKLISTLRDQYDYIIIDTPPLGVVIDSAVIANVCDGAALVIALNKISRKLAIDVKKQLEKSECKLLGVILNFTGETKRYTSYNGKYGYGKYGYGKYGALNSQNNENPASASNKPTENAGNKKGK